MQIKNIVRALVLFPIVALAADKIQPFNVKPGLWESTMTFTTGANAGGNARTTTSKHCVTKEQLEKGPDFGRSPECTPTVITSTSSKAEVRIVCETQNMKGSGTLSIEALTPESVKGTGQSTMTSGGYTVNVSTSFNSKWLGASCGETR